MGRAGHSELWSLYLWCGFKERGVVLELLTTTIGDEYCIGAQSQRYDLRSFLPCPGALLGGSGGFPLGRAVYGTQGLLALEWSFLKEGPCSLVGSGVAGLVGS